MNYVYLNIEKKEMKNSKWIQTAREYVKEKITLPNSEKQKLKM